METLTLSLLKPIELNRDLGLPASKSSPSHPPRLADLGGGELTLYSFSFKTLGEQQRLAHRTTF